MLWAQVRIISQHQITRHGAGYASVEYALAGIANAGLKERTLLMIRRRALAAPRNPRVGWQRAGAGPASTVVAVAFVVAILIRYGPLRGNLSARREFCAPWKGAISQWELGPPGNYRYSR
jgi:hypothetical protein